MRKIRHIPFAQVYPPPKPMGPERCVSSRMEDAGRRPVHRYGIQLGIVHQAASSLGQFDD